ncbi:MAG: diadenylate cyclase [Coprobacillus sp.]|nr:diadenylate cyclase [Coprobacillus sp.]
MDSTELYVWNSMSMAAFIISICAILLVYLLLFYSFGMVIKRKVPFIILTFFFVLNILTFIFNLMYVFIMVSVLLAVYLLYMLYTNLGDFRSFLGNPFKVVNAKNAKPSIERIYDREELYDQINTAVLSLAHSKTGAIITFERNTTLKDIIKNGIEVNAPVSSDLLLTIFYPGTRLHDGAVVIHNNTILAASVFFTPSTRPFAVKYGSRHRAAIGISEVSDAVTVVVSEETGRISIAVNGSLETVSTEKFLTVFTNYMSMDIPE